ncbi:MAG: hypothetical protein MZW92_31850 [Comamonadaceae bacterium]|nr:hypothetical protein [Comamonadaceae bacterium]
MPKKPEPTPEPGIERHTHVTREGGTVIINPPDESLATEESEDAENPSRPAREGRGHL